MAALVGRAGSIAGYWDAWHQRVTARYQERLRMLSRLETRMLGWRWSTWWTSVDMKNSYKQIQLKMMISDVIIHSTLYNSRLLKSAFCIKSMGFNRSSYFGPHWLSLWGITILKCLTSTICINIDTVFDTNGQKLQLLFKVKPQAWLNEYIYMDINNPIIRLWQYFD